MRHERHAEIDSTSAHARRLIHDPATAREPFAISAAIQTGGVGRRGRDWRSPPGGVWVTLAWPTARDVGAWELVSLAAARVIHEIVASLFLDEDRADLIPELRVKWPNDVLLRGGKLAGILCERVESPLGAWMLIGAGLNADMSVSDVGSLDRPVATLRAALGAPVDAGRLLGDLIERLADGLGAFESGSVGVSMIEWIDAVLAWRGERVVVDREGQTRVEGVLLGLDWAGGLRIAAESGEQSCPSGELRRIDD